MNERSTPLAVLRLLARIAGRNLRDSASFGLNNLIFVAIVLMQGSNNPRSALWSAAPLLLVLGLPLILTATGGPLDRVPPARFALWPLSARARSMVRITSILLSPIVWIGLLLVLLKAGLMLSAAFVGLVFGLQAGGPLILRAISKRMQRLSHRLRPQRGLSTVPFVRGGVAGIVQLSVRQLFSVLDLYAAILISMGGIVYRTLAPHPQPAAYPVLAIAVAIALSTYAQRSFALDGASGVARYRLLPLRGWQLLTAKDVGYLAVVVLLTAGLELRAGLIFALVAMAVGRWSSLQRLSIGRPRAMRWRFVAGDLGTGVLQILLGVGFSFASIRVGVAFSVAALVLYAASVVGGGWIWERGTQRASEVVIDPRRHRTPRS